jgi:hypothetical protein
VCCKADNCINNLILDATTLNVEDLIQNWWKQFQPFYSHCATLKTNFFQFVWFNNLTGWSAKDYFESTKYTTIIKLFFWRCQEMLYLCGLYGPLEHFENSNLPFENIHRLNIMWTEKCKVSLSEWSKTQNTYTNSTKQ